jgi:BlaI family transcriptional regulator, penicillinase repressor
MDRTLTDRELDIMNVLWDLGSGTVSEVRERLADELAYNTVLTVIRTLEAKGFVRYEGEGKAHRYFPRVKRETNAGSTLTRVLRKVFQDSPEVLLTHLVRERSLSAAELKRLRKLLDEGGKR